MLGLDEFTVGQLATLAGVPEATADTVLHEESQYVEISSSEEVDQQGHHLVRWQVRRSRREDLRRELKELEHQNVGPWLGGRQEDAQALPAGLLVAENVLLYLIPQRADAAERQGWIQLARAQMDIASSSRPSTIAEATAAAMQRQILHRRLASLLLDFAETELEIGSSKPLDIPAEVGTIVAALQDAADQLGDERLIASITYRLQSSPITGSRPEQAQAQFERAHPSGAPEQKSADLTQGQRNLGHSLVGQLPRVRLLVPPTVFYLAAFLVAVPLYLAYLAIIIPATTVVACIVYAIGIPAAFFAGLWRVLVGRPAEFTSPKRRSKVPADADPAVVQYFYGPALADAHHAVRTTYEDGQKLWKSGVRAVGDSFAVDQGAWFTAPPAVGGAIGIGLGTTVGALITAVFAFIHLLVVGISIALVRAIGTVLRGADTAVLRMKHVQMVCPYCYEHVPFPAYACPNPNCAHRHRDIRPGKYGILRRRCLCGTTMSTLSLYNLSRISAFCPHPGCEQSLDHRPRDAADIVLPFVGATGAGKTRLLLSMVTQLQAWAGQGQLMAEFGDTTTAKSLDVAGQVLRSGTPTARTPAELPRAHVIRLNVKKRARTLQMYDAAGESFYHIERVQELRYLGKARTFILVIDPLSVEFFWQQLPSATQAELSSVRSAAPPPELAYEQTFQQIEAMGVRLRKARLAVVFSRSDLINSQDGNVVEWAANELALGNLIRSATQQFKETAYFRTAAVMVADDLVHESIIELMRWVMSHEGIDLPGVMR
jgi:Double-GTPase 2